MQARVQQRSRQLQRQVSEMAWAVPQVIHQRVGRMIAAGPMPNAGDQHEFYRMGAEKVAALQESWMAASMGAFTAQQEIALAWVEALMTPPGQPQAFNRLLHAGQAAALGMVGASLAPVHGRAMGNARRLRAVT